MNDPNEHAGAPRALDAGVVHTTACSPSSAPWLTDGRHRAPPDTTALLIRVLAGRDNRGKHYHRAAAWLGDAIRIDLIEIPGGHTPYLADAREFAAALMPFLSGEAARAI